MPKKISEEQFDDLVQALLTISRYDIRRLIDINRDEFGKKTNTINSIFKDGKCKFKDIKNKAIKELTKMGIMDDSNVNYTKDGYYLIVGDSHGKHTKRGMFRLLHNLNNNFKFNKIIHIGHILDDDNDISYLWKQFSNLVVIAREEELIEVEEKREEYKFELINGKITIGDYVIRNQDFITDYVKTNLASLDPYIFDTNVIVNLHRLELDNKGFYQRVNTYASPGALCEKHIISTIKQIDFRGDRQVKETYPLSYQKYRRRREMTEYWENGCIILEKKHNIINIYPISIKKINNEYATSYFDKIYVDSRIEEVDNKIFFFSDVHCDKHDSNVIYLEDKFTKEYKPNISINMGDMINNKSLNHHEMEKGYYIKTEFMDEFSSYCQLLKIMQKWSKENHIIFGNHERFMNDFTNKFPQFKTLFEFLYEKPLEQLGFIKHGLKECLDINGAKFLHGDLKLFGQTGSLIERMARTFGKDTIIGHLHTNSIRYGCYIVGLSGSYNQEYNDIQGSRWSQGFGFCNQYKGENFIQLVNINKEYNFVLNGKIFFVKDLNEVFDKKINLNLTI